MARSKKSPSRKDKADATTRAAVNVETTHEYGEVKEIEESSPAVNGASASGRKKLGIRELNAQAECYLCHAEAVENGSTSNGAPHKYFKLYENDVPEEPKGLAGIAVKRLGIWAYIIFILIPLLFVSIFYAVIPLGDFRKTEMRDQWVFIFVSNSTVYAVISWLYVVTFRGMADIERPFRASWIPPFAVFVAEAAVFSSILLTHGVFDLLGSVAYAICVVTTLVATYFVYPEHRAKLFQFTLRFMSLLVFFIAVLTGYVIAFRESRRQETVQRVLVFAMSFATFIYRRVMLSRLDQFPLNLSLILSGFWVQNLNDIFQVMAFPQVGEPSTFGLIWLSNSFGNFALIGFVSNLWVFKLRPFLKTYVKHGAKCNFPIPPLPEPDFSFDPVNRGHDNNVGGYRRRQFRFFFWRLLSQFSAMIFYLAVAPQLRYAFNEEWMLFGEIDTKEFRNSMIYAAVNLLFIMGVMVLGYWYVNKRHHPTFHEMREIHGHEYINHTFVGYNVLIMTHNLLLAVGVIVTHNCLLGSFQNPKCFFDNAIVDD